MAQLSFFMIVSSQLATMGRLGEDQIVSIQECVQEKVQSRELDTINAEQSMPKTMPFHNVAQMFEEQTSILPDFLELLEKTNYGNDLFLAKHAIGKCSMQE